MVKCSGSSDDEWVGRQKTRRAEAFGERGKQHLGPFQRTLVEGSRGCLADTLPAEPGERSKGNDGVAVGGRRDARTKAAGGRLQFSQVDLPVEVPAAHQRHETAARGPLAGLVRGTIDESQRNLSDTRPPNRGCLRGDYAGSSGGGARAHAPGSAAERARERSRRPPAAVRMLVRDFDDEGELASLVVREKGGKERRVPCHHKAREYLRAYIRAAGFEPRTKVPLFQTAPGKKPALSGVAMTGGDAWEAVKRWCERDVLPSSICNHSFRATGITVHQENGGRLEDAQELAGHADARKRGSRSPAPGGSEDDLGATLSAERRNEPRRRLAQRRRPVATRGSRSTMAGPCGISWAR